MNNGTPNAQNELDQILSGCLDSAGYLVFVAKLTPKRDKDGNAVIDFEYRRHHLSLEDAKQSVAVLKKFIDDEIERLIQTESEMVD